MTYSTVIPEANNINVFNKGNAKDLTHLYL